MKRLLLFAMVCALCAVGARAQISVTGNLQTLGVQNASGANTFARFTLQNYGGSLPIVTSSGAMVSDYQDFHTNGSGVFSGVIYGNDLISPNGTTYQVCIFFNGIQFRCARYLITAALYPSGFNLNSATPITIPPVVNSTTIGARSYAFTQSSAATTWTITHNLGDPNPSVQCFDASGNIIYPDKLTYTSSTVVTALFVSPQAGGCKIISAGNVNPIANMPNAVITNPSIPQTIQGPNPLNLQGPLNVTSINNVVFADQQAGADACAKVTAALGLGSIINATAFTGALACAGGFTVGSNQVVYLGNATFTVGGQLTLSGTGAHVYGIPGVTTIKQSGGFPASTPIAQIGTGIMVSSATFEGIVLNCNSAANSIGGENQNGEELSGFFNVVVQNCTKYSLWYEASTAQNSSGRAWTILPSGGGGGTIGAYIHNVPSFRGIQDATFNTNDASTIGNALTLDGVTGGSFDNIHIEHATNGVDLGPVTQTVGVSLKNIYGNASVPTLVKVENIAGNRVTLQNLIANGSATTVNDGLNSITRTDATLPRYMTFGPTGNQVLIEDGTVGRSFLHVGTNQNFRFESQSSLTTIEAVNDASSVDVPLSLAASAVVLPTIGPSTAQQHTLPAVASDTFALLVATQTLTNKTLGSPTVNLLTNGTGLQVFNTTTTCTTGASVGATCTTAAITLPVAEADTAYRVTCTGKGPTAVPVISSIANSSATQFTITIAALTAVAASFTSFDCSVGHN